MQKKGLIIFILMIFVLSGCGHKQGLDNEVKPTVSVIEAKEENLLIEKVYEAVLKLDGEEVITAKAPGYLRKTFRNEGELVKSGDKLALLENDALSLSAERLDKEIIISEIQYEKLRVQAAEAEKELERNQALYQSGAISKLDLEKSEAKWDLAFHSMEEAQKRLELTGINREESLLNNSNLLVTAPSDMWLAESLIQVGEYVNVGQALFTGGKKETLLMHLELKRDEIKDWQIGEKLKAESGGIVKDATITNINQLSHPASEYVSVELKVDNTDYDWFPGAIAQIKYTNEIEKQVLLPVDAIAKGKEAYVYVVKKNKVSRQPVTLGLVTGKEISVFGLKDGDIVVTEGLHRLRDGEEVNIKEGF